MTILEGGRVMAVHNVTVQGKVSSLEPAGREPAMNELRLHPSLELSGGPITHQVEYITSWDSVIITAPIYAKHKTIISTWDYRFADPDTGCSAWRQEHADCRWQRYRSPVPWWAMTFSQSDAFSIK